MAGRAVFVDRDKTLIEDPGYIGDPRDVKLLPGVDHAIRSLHQAGYKVIVVTNQSGVARGLITEEMLQEIHAEMRRQLRAKGVHLDGIYYCPYHPEGTVEQYARDSELRKPQPGMLLKAAAEMDVDLTESWMVGDGARDIEAGTRAGCRTIRIRQRPIQPGQGEESWDDDESVQSDFTVRNLFDAARLILREGRAGAEHQPAAPAAPVTTAEAGVTAEAQASPLAELPEGAEPHQAAKPAELAQPAPQTAPAAPAEPPAPPEQAGQSRDEPEVMNDSRVRQEILRYVRQLVVEKQAEEFSFTKLMGGVVQMLALLSLMMTFLRMLQNELQASLVWGVVTVALQVMALTFFVIQRSK